MAEKLLPLASLTFVFITLVSAIFLFPVFEKPKKPQVKSINTQSVPELAEILSGDQETRLTATRRLAERVDVGQALEILNNSPLPRTGEGHLAVHQIGFYAYREHGLDAILLCKDYFLYACYHGAIIEAASDQGFSAIAKMVNRCKATSARHFQCAHAAGHAILAIWDYDLPEALKTCDQIFEGESQFPETLSSCHNGAFMENLFGVHDWGVREAKDRKWLSEDPYFPCNASGEKYQKGCWLNQAARIYQMNTGDIVKTWKLCEKIGNWQYTVWCMDNLARQIHPTTAGNILKVFEFCGQVGSFWFENCVVVNAGSYFSVGGYTEAIEICQRLEANAKSACYQTIIGQINSGALEKTQSKVICQEMEAEFEKQCLSQI